MLSFPTPVSWSQTTMKHKLQLSCLLILEHTIRINFMMHIKCFSVITMSCNLCSTSALTSSCTSIEEIYNTHDINWRKNSRIGQLADVGNSWGRQFSIQADFQSIAFTSYTQHTKIAKTCELEDQKHWTTIKSQWVENLQRKWEIKSINKLKKVIMNETKCNDSKHRHQSKSILNSSL